MARASKAAQRRARTKWKRANPKVCWLDSIRSRARKRGVPVDITVEDLTIPEVCPALGIPIVKEYGTVQNDNSPSVDCVIPELGYVKGNVRVISWKANRIKSNANLDDLVGISLYISAHITKNRGVSEDNT